MDDRLKDASILITGGTGSFGKAFLERLLTEHSPRRIVVFSRDELKQYEMKQVWGGDTRVRFFLGDIRDRERLSLALHGVDVVIHAAALKQVDTAEYNPMEYVKTNILGSENVIQSCIEAGVKKVIALSTDKASSPVNLYGATKLTARMTRFWITLPQAVEFVISSLEDMTGGELYVPRIPSMRVVDLATAIDPSSAIEEIGIRPGEKLHEEMISTEDSRRTLRREDRYVVTPTIAEWGFRNTAGEQVPEGFSYSSDTNDQWLDVEGLRNMLDQLGL